MFRFKRIVNWAVEIEWLKNNPFANLNFVRDLFICSRCTKRRAFARSVDEARR